MRKILLLIAGVLPLALCAQEDSAGSRFKAIVSAGMVSGESSARPFFQFSSGIRFNRIFTGIGAGLDPYRFGSVPLFIDWRINFGRINSGFVYLNSGYNFPYSDHGDDNSSLKSADKFKGGFYMDAGIGCRLALKGIDRLSVSAGYSYKRMDNLVTYSYSWCPECEDQFYTYRYDLGRIMTRLSWEFGK